MSAVVESLTGWFLEFGFPERIRTDGGPQFRSEFGQFCVKWDIVHEISSPHNPQSNGLAEAGVKNAKHLLMKCASAREFAYRMLEWRNTPRACSPSPASLFFGRQLKGFLPRLSSPFSGAKLPVGLRTGMRVRVQSPLSKRWDSTGTLRSPCGVGESWDITLDTGKVIRRNVRYIKPTK